MIDQEFVDIYGDTLELDTHAGYVRVATVAHDGDFFALYFHAHQIDAIIAALQMARDAAGG